MATAPSMRISRPLKARRPHYEPIVHLPSLPPEQNGWGDLTSQGKLSDDG
jgi:hypothetical protein